MFYVEEKLIFTWFVREWMKEFSIWGEKPGTISPNFSVFTAKAELHCEPVELKYRNATCKELCIPILASQVSARRLVMSNIQSRERRGWGDIYQIYTYCGEFLNIFILSTQWGKSNLLWKLGEFRIRKHWRVTKELMNHISGRKLSVIFCNERLITLLGSDMVIVIY